ncbi:MAG: glycosyltransferase family 4 protein [Rhodospirillales bacterium]
MPQPLTALFAHDHFFVETPDGGCFSDGQFPALSWSRYLEHVDRLIVCARRRGLRPGEAVEGLSSSRREGVSFRFVPDLSGVRGIVSGHRRAARVLREIVGSVDAVVVRLPSNVGLLAAALAKEAGKPVAVEVAGCVWDGLWNYGRLQAKAYAPIAFWRMRRTIRAAPYVLYVTREFLQSRYPTDGVQASASNVQLASPDGAVLERRLRRLAGGPRTPFVLGIIASLKSNFKGIQTALAALSVAAADLPSFQFRVLGAGDPARWRTMAAERGLADRVRFDGVLPSGEPVMAWLDDVDLYLQPSFKEGVPRALIEAMSRGCPAIASTCGGIPELLDDDCLHRPGDDKALAARIARAARDSSWLGQQARRNFEKSRDYDPQALSERRSIFWNAFFSEAAARRPR